MRPRPLIPRALRTRAALAVATVAATGALMALSASAAGAETFCVHQSGHVCPGSSIDEGTDLQVTATAMAHHHRVTVGTLTSRLGAGHEGTLTLTLNRAGRALRASTGRLTVILTVTVHNGARTLMVETAHVRLT